MLVLSIVVTCLLILCLLLNGTAFIQFLRVLARRPPPNHTPRYLPKVGIVLSLRGFDEVLLDCLGGLLRLDYPDYVIHVIVDSTSDPAWPVVQQAANAAPSGRIVVQPLQKILKTCSLKCSSLIQAIDAMHPSCEVIAMLDADVIPHRTWLRELVSPLADPAVGAVTGARCFATRDFATAVRALWGASAASQQVLFQIDWGGSLAIRRETHRKLEMNRIWSTTFNDDIVLGCVVREAGLQTQFVPSLMMINREGTTFSGFLKFITRQMVHVRFYLPPWPYVVLLTTAFSISIPAGFLLAIVSACLQLWLPCLLLAASLGLYLAGIWGLVAIFEQIMHRIAAERGESYAAMGFWMIPALPVTLIFTAWSVLAACFTRTVVWRGVRYYIHSPRRVELASYAPFAAPPGRVEIAELAPVSHGPVPQGPVH